MSLATIVPFVTWITALVVLAGAVLVVSVLAAATEFFVEHRAARVARHEPFVGYYRHLATGH